MTPEAEKEPSLNARLMSLGISESYASQLVTGFRTPSLPLALKIERALGIEPKEWAERFARRQEAATASGAVR